MSLRLVLARLYLPAAIRKRKLGELARLTARAFGTAAPALDGLSLAGMRLRYAEFTRQAAERALARAEGPATIERRLFDEAVRFGRDIRRELRVSTRREAIAAARLLYRSLKIDLSAGPEGGIVIRRCFFSRHYPAAVCRLMSALDAGVLSGLSGGGELEFTERLTEGDACCRARLRFPGEGR